MNSFRHAVVQLFNRFLVYQLGFFLGDFKQFPFVWRRSISKPFADSILRNRSHRFNWRQIRWTSWPEQGHAFSIFEVFFDNSCSVNWSVVSLKYKLCVLILSTKQRKTRLDADGSGTKQQWSDHQRKKCGN